MNKDLRDFILSMAKKRRSKEKIISKVVYKYGLEAGNEANDYLDSVQYKPESSCFRAEEKEAIKSTNDAFRILAGIISIFLSTAMLYEVVYDASVEPEIVVIILFVSVIGIIGGIIAFSRPIIGLRIIVIDIILAISLSSSVMKFLLFIPFGLLIPYASERNQQRKLNRLNVLNKEVLDKNSNSES